LGVAGQTYFSQRCTPTVPENNIVPKQVLEGTIRLRSVQNSSRHRHGSLLHCRSYSGIQKDIDHLQPIFALTITFSSFCLSSTHIIDNDYASPRMVLVRLEWNFRWRQQDFFRRPFHGIVRSFPKGVWNLLARRLYAALCWRLHLP
jgi:hypothetical protein